MKTATKKDTARISVPFQIKAEGANDEQRTFQGLASTWDLDLGADVIHMGAYTRTISHWKQTGRVIPLVDLHAYDSTRKVVGKVIDMEETAEGLLCTFQMIEAGDLDADAAWRRVKGGFITGLSIGYRAVRYDYEVPEGKESWERIRHLYEVELREISLVIWGMNEGALIDTDSAKSAQQRKRLWEYLRGKGASEDEIRALLEDAPDADPADDPATPPPGEPKGLAPEDPKRLWMEEQLRELTLRSLAPA